jgi:hypothetical protein
VELVCEVDLDIGHVSAWVAVMLAREDELREGGLVARRVLNLHKMLVVRHRVVLRQLQQGNESLQQRRPEARRAGMFWATTFARESSSPHTIQGGSVHKAIFPWHLLLHNTCNVLTVYTQSSKIES